MDKSWSQGAWVDSGKGAWVDSGKASWKDSGTGARSGQSLSALHSARQPELGSRGAAQPKPVFEYALALALKVEENLQG